MSEPKRQRPDIDTKLCYICQANAKELVKKPTAQSFTNAIKVATERQIYNDPAVSKFMDRHTYSTLTGLK